MRTLARILVITAALAVPCRALAQSARGFAFGAAPALAMAGSDVIKSGPAIAVTAAGGLLYGGVGWLIDNAIEGRDVIYELSDRAPALAVSLEPIVSLRGSKRLGLGGSITWR